MSNRTSMPTKLLLTLAITVTGLLMSGPAAFASFSAPTQFDVGTGPDTITLGDLNGDGNLDAVTPASSLGKVSVLLGNGDGSFEAKTDYVVGTAPTSIAIANLNPDSDSFPDLAVSNSISDTMSILFGDGTGSFPTSTDLAVGDYPVYVAAGKLSADGKTDLVVANQNSGDITVLINDGNATFSKSTITTGAGARSVAIDDLNNDGKSDLAVVNSGGGGGLGNGNGSILLGNGDGTFQTPVDFETSLGPMSIAAGDLDGDGFVDLAVANIRANSVGVSLNNGVGGFGPATYYTTGSNPRTIAIGNLVGDDSLDLVAANQGQPADFGTSVSVFEGNGDGGFAPKVDYPAGTGPSGVAVGDLNADLNPDLAVSGSGSKISVLLNQAPTATASPSTLSFPDQALNMASGDLPVTVANSAGGDPLSISGFSIDGANAADFKVNSEACTADPVPLDGNCLMQVGFTPSALGQRSATLNITYNGGGSPLKVPLTGTGIDVTAPDTVIDSGPSGTITTDSATFAFHGDPAGDTAKIMCKLDAAAFADCTSPKTFPGLADGSHTVAFRAQDSAGNQDPTPATRTFTVDTFVPPILQAKIGKVTVKGPAKAKKGKKAGYTVKVTNSGDAAATGVKLKVSGKGVSLKKTIGQVAAGETRSFKVKLRFKKPGKVKATFKVTSSNGGTKTVKKKVKVKKKVRVKK